MINKKVFQFLLTFLGSFVGQLIVRITTLDGSLDKWWLLVPPLSVPPLSIIPAYLIYKNKVKKGYAGRPYDSYILIPAISIIICGMVIEKSYKDSGIRGTLFKFLINFFSISIALYLRDVDMCVFDLPPPKCTPQSVPIPRKQNSTPPISAQSTPKKSTSSTVKISLPKINLPKISLPSIPKINLPKINLPSIPKINLPSIPKINLPSVPKVNLPPAPKIITNAKANISKGISNIRGKFRVNEDFIQVDDFVKKFNKINSKSKKIQYNKIILQSAIICVLIPIMPYFIVKVPILNKIVSKVGNISPHVALILDGIVRLLTVMLVYSLINMYNGRKPDKSCNKKTNKNNAIYVLIISIVINIIMSNKADLIPYNKSELNPE